jgi:hypothetical protein
MVPCVYVACVYGITVAIPNCLCMLFVSSEEHSVCPINLVGTLGNLFGTCHFSCICLFVHVVRFVLCSDLRPK